MQLSNQLVLGVHRGSKGSGGASWSDAWTLDTAQKPAALLDFANDQYFDGSSSSAAMSTLVQNATRDANGLICSAGNINVIGNFLTALKNASGATVVAEISGGSNASSAGILCMSSGGPDGILITNPGNTSMDSFNGTSCPGPTGVDFTKQGTFTSAYNNSGTLSLGTAGQIVNYAKNFSAITTAQFGSYNGASFFSPGRIRNIAVYTGKLADKYLKNMSWPGAWNRPFNGCTAIQMNGGTFNCGTGLNANFKSNLPWTCVGSGIRSAGNIGNIGVLFTNVANAGSPPWYGHELYVNAVTGKLRASIFSGWAGGAASTNIIQVEGSTNIADGKWHTYGCTYDGSQVAAGIKLYVDGVAEALTVTYNNLTGASDTNIGFFQVGGQFGSFLTDYVDFFAMSNIVRPASYFTSIQATRTRPSVDANTLVQYDFREASGTTVFDRTSNGNNATLSGGVTWL